MEVGRFHLLLLTCSWILNSPRRNQTQEWLTVDHRTDSDSLSIVCLSRIPLSTRSIYYTWCCAYSQSMRDYRRTDVALLCRYRYRSYFVFLIIVLRPLCVVVGMISTMVSTTIDIWISVSYVSFTALRAWSLTHQLNAGLLRADQITRKRPTPHKPHAHKI